MFLKVGEKCYTIRNPLSVPGACMGHASGLSALAIVVSRPQAKLSAALALRCCRCELQIYLQRGR